MASDDDQAILRRKVALSAAIAAQGGPGAERCWRVVLARSARDAMALGLEVTALDLNRVSLTELLELPVAQSLIAVLDGPQGGLGLMAISPGLLAAMTEIQTIGKLATVASVPRKPTRTDAAMVAGFIDAALTGLEAALADEADLVWAGGFRYASFLDDPRPLGLLLDDVAYRVQVAEVAIENGARSGQILLALPANGRGERPISAANVTHAAIAGRAFAADLTDQIEGSNCVLHAILQRIVQPLSDIMALQVGDILPLSLASVDQIVFEGLDGQRLAEGRLGQNRGMRAVRLTPPSALTRSDRRPQGEIITVPEAVAS